MKIVYDGLIFRIQKAGGINRYFSEIIGGLPADWSPVLFGHAELGANRPRHPNLKIRANGPFFRPMRVSSKLRQLRWDRRVVRGADLLHPTYFGLSDGLKFGGVRCPILVTVYDMIFAKYTPLIDYAESFCRIQREAVLRADHVVCISKSTEADLLEIVPEAAGKTSVIYLGSSFTRGAQKPDPAPEGPIRFLYVGARSKYKNFSFLLRAFSAAARAFPGIRLRIAGPPLTEQEKWEIYLLGISDSVDACAFPDEPTLQRYYTESTALLYPSLYEGFGIPPLEAMACGTLVVTGDTSSLPEVVGDGGIMIDPRNEGQWTDCILQIARGRINRGEMLARGSLQAARFSWADAQRRHLDLYKSMAR